jgi:putative protease
MTEKNDPGVQPRIELLAPAGDPEKMRTAILYGADAVYLAARDFGLRASGKNFTAAELREAVDYAHARGVRVYLTLNILAHPEDMADLAAQIDELADAGPDAVIVSDPGVFSLLRQKQPKMNIHISTQASTTNAAACRFWYQQGAERVILARELTLTEISEIRREVPPDMQLEAFVHGAMCLAYSGRCLLSQYFTGRDANRGRCVQACRWSYEITEAGHPDKPVIMNEDARGTYLLNSRDLCMIEHIPELVAAGISSFKIEGRAKSSYYVATVTKAYRAALDAYFADPGGWRADPAWLTELEQTVHRPFTTGFYYARPQDDAAVAVNELDQRAATVAGVVKAWLPESSLALVEQRNKIRVGETLELVSPRRPNRQIVVKSLFDLERQPINSTPHPRMHYFMPLSEPAAIGAMLRRFPQKPSESD